MSMDAEIKHDQYQHFIAGQWVDASDGNTFDDLDPYTGDTLASVADCKPTSSCILTTSRMAESSSALSSSSESRPPACSSRALSSLGGRNRLPT